jgi:hypothetical protein
VVGSPVVERLGWSLIVAARFVCSTFEDGRRRWTEYLYRERPVAPSALEVRMRFLERTAVVALLGSVLPGLALAQDVVYGEPDPGPEAVRVVHLQDAPVRDDQTQVFRRWQDGHWVTWTSRPASCRVVERAACPTTCAVPVSTHLTAFHPIDFSRSQPDRRHALAYDASATFHPVDFSEETVALPSTGATACSPEPIPCGDPVVRSSVVCSPGAPVRQLGPIDPDEDLYDAWLKDTDGDGIYG